MAISMIGQIQFRQVGGFGGAVGTGLSPGGGGFACLLMTAPCAAQYALGNEHGGAVEAAGLQVSLRLVGGVQRVRMHRDL